MINDMGYSGNLLSGKLPEGFGMALAQNTYAMQYFSALPEQERRAVIERARNVGSKADMQALVDSLILH